MQKLKVFKGDVLIFLAMAIFGSYPLFFRLFQGIHPLTFVLAFQVIGAVAFLILSAGRIHAAHSPRDWMLLLGLALVALANDVLYIASIRLTSIANAAVAHQSVSIFLLPLAPLILQERTRREEWIALIFSLLGISVLYWGGFRLSTADDLIGITLGILSGLFLALLFILYRVVPDQDRGINTRMVNFWRYIISAILLLPFAPLMGITTVSQSDVIPIVMFGALFAVVASGIHTFALNQTRSLHASIIGKSEPVFAMIYAFFVLNEQPTVEVMVGGILIIGSSIWLALRKEKLK